MTPAITRPEQAAVEESVNRRQVWTRIESQLTPRIPAGFSPEWTVKNLKGWWETPQGIPVAATHPEASEWMVGVWGDFSSVTLESTWEQMWREDSEWLLRKAAPDYGLGPGKGMA